MPNNAQKTLLANSAKALAARHGFSKDEQDQLEQALRASARAIAPTPIGITRNELYASHKDQIFAQFQGHWDWSKTSQSSTMSSIRKILSNYLFDFNKKQAKTTRQKDVPEPNVSKPKHVVPYLKEDTPVRRSRGHLPKHKSLSSFTPINKRSLSPTSQLLPKLLESPFDKPSSCPLNAVLSSTENTPIEPGSEDATELLPNLSDVILVVYPSSSDPWGRDMFFFPLWRCQVPAANGRDAAPDSLRDWRDLSFVDFVRQLKSEQVLAPEEMVVWSEYNHVITSDMTFASAVQEQLHDASSNKTAPNEATFAIVCSRLLALLIGKSSVLTFNQNQRSS